MRGGILAEGGRGGCGAEFVQTSAAITIATTVASYSISRLGGSGRLPPYLEDFRRNFFLFFFIFLQGHGQKCVRLRLITGGSFEALKNWKLSAEAQTCKLLVYDVEPHTDMQLW